MEDYLETEVQDNVLVVKVLTEHIDLANIGDIKKDFGRIEIPEDQQVVMNINKVTFIDSSGIGWLISIHQQYKKKNKNLFLVSNKTELREIFALTYIDKLLTIYETEDEAIKAM